MERNKEVRIKGSESKILAIGGSYLSKTAEIFNLLKQPPSLYPDLPEACGALCSVSFDDYVYIIGGGSIKIDESGGEGEESEDEEEGENVEDKDSFHKESDDDDEIPKVTSVIYRMNLKEDILKWNKVPSMNERRGLMSATICDGSIFVAGGENEVNDVLSSAECFIPVLNVWQYIPKMKHARAGHALVTCKDCLYAIGGGDGDDYFETVERFLPGSDVWVDITSLLTPRSLLAAAVVDDVIYAIGGEDGGEALKSVERYDITSMTWEYVKDMNEERAYFSACVMQGKIYVCGGYNKDGDISKTIECYDPSRDEWTIVGETEDELIYNAMVAV